MIYTITSATGQLGQKVVAEAQKQLDTNEIRLSVRSPQKASQYAAAGIDVRAADYLDVDSMVEAWRGTDVLIYIPSISHPSIVRVPEFENSVIAAERAGVKHFIFVGFFADQVNSPFHMAAFFAYANTRLASAGFSYSIIKNAMYADPLVPYLPELIERKAVIYPMGNSKMSFISREDSAVAIVKLAMSSALQGKTYILTQGRNYTMLELADLLSEISGHEIDYQPVTVEEFAALYDQPKGFGVVLASLYQAGSQGCLDIVTDDFRTITGRQAMDLKNYMMKNYQK
ncbi:NAD(P)-dependent oxidoreductase [Streptococcus anginosus]|uniref:SDR family oxidoreductase n=1 Tax=Streptococcus anginosus TaxID=1328 RepID=UPI000D028709|nr:SDR family oxidoreductase [Streptococcus anginosus]MCY7232630.1 SDR family oxidoreductase [Streptococcus anginosus]PRT62832.1 NAD(P)-dependent oxidoreductase [Streptococcus anginosus]